MGNSHYKFMRRKQRRGRVIVIALICIILSVIAVSMRECSQSMTEPLDKTYQPKDRVPAP